MLNIFFLPCPFVLPLSLIQLAYTFVFAARRSLSQFTYHLLQWNPVNLCCTWCSTSVTSVVATGVRNVRFSSRIRSRRARDPCMGPALDGPGSAHLFSGSALDYLTSQLLTSSQHQK